MDQMNTPPQPLDDAAVLARYLAEYGVRNSILENLHAGTAPRSQAGDDSDIVVVTPFGEIPWSKVSRITDPEMRSLMLNVEKQIAECLRTIATFEQKGELSKFVDFIRHRSFGPYGVSWDIPPQKWAERQAMVEKLRNERDDHPSKRK